MFKKIKKGFTLVELVIVIAIVAILAAVSVGAYFGITDSANNSRLEQESKQVYTAVQTVALAPNDHSSLSSSGLIITNLQKFETELEKNLGKDVYLTDVVDEKASIGPTICFSAEAYVKATLGGSTVYRSFQYHNAEIGGKKYVADIVTGEGHVAKVDSTTTPDTPSDPAVASKIVLTEYHITLGHNSEGYKVEATVYDQYNEPMDVLGEWVEFENNALAYSPTQGLNRLVVWGQNNGVAKFKFVYQDIESDILTISVVIEEQTIKSYVITYPLGTTTNMTGNNDAALFGLNAQEIDIKSVKCTPSNRVGLNKDGTIRLYADKDSGDGNELHITVANGTINSVNLRLGDSVSNFTVNGLTGSKEQATYLVDSNTVIIKNTHLGTSTQLHLASIELRCTI